MPGTILGALYAQDSQPAYPLGGTIVSGMSNTQTLSAIENRRSGPNHPGDRVAYPIEAKDHIMFHTPSRTVDPGMLKLGERLHRPAPYAEVKSMPEDWLPRWKDEWAARVEVPVL